MYAVIESCGKQYKVAEGDVVFFEKLDGEEGKKVTFENVILVADGEKIEIGTPFVKDIKVEGKVLAHGKAKKIIVFKYKAKKNYKRKQGHRQPYTKDGRSEKTWLIRKVKVVLKTEETVSQNVLV